MSVYKNEDAIARIEANDPCVTIAELSYMRLLNLDFMLNSTYLKELSIESCEEWTSLEPLRGNATLEVLDISECQVDSLDVVNHMPSLKRLTVYNNLDDLSIDFLSTNVTVTHLVITGIIINSLEQ
jgi:hypothetical protein